MIFTYSARTPSKTNENPNIAVENSRCTHRLTLKCIFLGSPNSMCFRLTMIQLSDACVDEGWGEQNENIVPSIMRYYGATFRRRSFINENILGDLIYMFYGHAFTVLAC